MIKSSPRITEYETGLRPDSKPRTDTSRFEDQLERLVPTEELQITYIKEKFSDLDTQFRERYQQVFDLKNSFPETQTELAELQRVLTEKEGKREETLSPEDYELIQKLYRGRSFESYQKLLTDYGEMIDLGVRTAMLRECIVMIRALESDSLYMQEIEPRKRHRHASDLNPIYFWNEKQRTQISQKRSQIIQFVMELCNQKNKLSRNDLRFPKLFLETAKYCLNDDSVGPVVRRFNDEDEALEYNVRFNREIFLDYYDNQAEKQKTLFFKHVLENSRNYDSFEDHHEIRLEERLSRGAVRLAPYRDGILTHSIRDLDRVGKIHRQGYIGQQHAFNLESGRFWHFIADRRDPTPSDSSFCILSWMFPREVVGTISLRIGVHRGGNWSQSGEEKEIKIDNFPVPIGLATSAIPYPKRGYNDKVAAYLKTDIYANLEDKYEGADGLYQKPNNP